jgi:ribosomal protein S18 acetylase RimI-like enzyme
VNALAIRPARFPDDAPRVRALFREYAAGLPIDLGFQGFEAELAALPGAYGAPDGAVLLAERDGNALGCVAVRPLADGACEMKRLYVRPDARGEQLGARLIAGICALARERGYRAMRLDTLATMLAAQRLYTAAGFRPIGAYGYNPLPDARYFELDLVNPPPDSHAHDGWR